jgi:hypothetical protein
VAAVSEVLRTTLTGDRELRASLESAISEAPKELRKSLKVVGAALLELTQPHVPVKKGKLKASGRFTTLVSASRSDIGIRLVYGGPTAPYAVQVHENLQAHHRNGEAKFVERPLMAKKPEIAGDIARELSLRRMVGK